jgi:apolipoprotein N-acyltransferase
MYPAMAWMWFLTAPGYLIAGALFAGYHAVAAAFAPHGAWGPIGRPASHALAEAIRFSVPFGGVPLASLGISQAGGPLLGLARVGGVMLLTWVVFQLGVVLAGAATLAADTARSSERTWRHALSTERHAAVATATIVVALIVAAVAPQGDDSGELTIAAVQGGGPQGTRALDVPSSVVTERHLEATRTIKPGDDLDLVVWPENGIDVDNEPFTESPEYALVVAEAQRLGVPLSVGVTIDSEYSAYPRDDSFVNAQVIVLPDGRVTSWYEKVQIVPFGEYVPFRGALEALGAPLDNVASDATRGRDPAVLHVDHDDIDAKLGVMISWEVFFGHRGRAGDDAQILLNPTNGASYTWTILQTQQIASSKLRAVETGRWVVQVSPTGFSAFISPDGDVIDRTGVSEQRVITANVALRDGATWYSTLGDWPWWIGLLVVLAVSGPMQRRIPRPTRVEGDDDE